MEAIMMDRIPPMENDTERIQLKTRAKLRPKKITPSTTRVIKTFLS
jgi:hypothetical protein